MDRNGLKKISLILAVIAAVAWWSGCERMQRDWETFTRKMHRRKVRAAGAKEVPEPIDILLPRKIRIHAFTGTRIFDANGDLKGIEVRLEAKDGFDDSTKAFGEFIFELYRYRPNNADPRGERIAVWEENLLDPYDNLKHWHGISRTYRFKLLWDEPIPTGKRFVLEAVYSSPFTERMFDRYVFVAGQ